MRKRAFLAFILVAALLMTAGCSLVVKDEEVDKQTVIIDVAGQQITKEQVLTATQNVLDYQSYMYYLYGQNFDATSETNISAAREQAMNGLIQDVIIGQKEEELGLMTFTAEEQDEINKSVDTMYQGYADSVKSAYFAQTELTGEALDTAISEKMVELGYGSKEDLMKSQQASKAYDKLKQSVVKDVTVTDDEIQADYDSKVASAKETYQSNLSAYGSAVQSGSAVYYAPAGYRYVKNLLRKLGDEDSKAISDMNTQITDKQTQLSNVESSISDLGEATAEETEEQKKSRADLESTKATLDTEIADLQKKLTETTEAAYQKLQPTIDEIQQKLAAGESFDSLLETYGEDTGMQSSPAKEKGYLVCESSTNWATEFTKAAMALEKIGDVSPAVRTSFGIHLIQYASDLAEGAVPLADVKDEISTALLTSKQDELFNTTLEQWVTDAHAKIYEDRLK